MSIGQWIEDDEQRLVPTPATLESGIVGVVPDGQHAIVERTAPTASREVIFLVSFLSLVALFMIFI